VKGHPYEQGFDLRLVPEKLTEPLRWKKPRRVFVNSMSDLFHEDLSAAYIADVFAVMARTPQHTYQVLTKRPERMLMLLLAPPAGVEPWPLPNVWLGVSVENQHFADERIPLLLQTPAAVRFISAEPLLDAVDLSPFLPVETIGGVELERWLDWVIVGGESGPGARPFNIEWARSIVQQCQAAGVPVFVKQLGRFAIDDSNGTAFRMALRSTKGGESSEWPADLRVREFPT
jgi:protein gp37